MASSKKVSERVRPVKIYLDGKAVTLPVETTNSLAAIRSHLELLALRQDRVLSALIVDGESVNLQQPPVLREGFRQVQAQSVGFGELGQELAGTAVGQTLAVYDRTQIAVALVLINSWAGASRMVQGLQADLRTLLIVMSFLQELCGAQFVNTIVNDLPLAQHWSNFGLIQQQIQAAVGQRSNLAVSDALERYLAPWLLRLSAYLKKMSPPR
jgi:hypothetical protein